MKLTRSTISLSRRALLVAAFTLPLCGYSAVITQTVDNIDWNDAMWGTPAAAPTAGNDYVSALGGTDRFRIGADGSGSTFGGDSLTLVSGTRALSKMQGTAVGTISGNFILDGGWLSFAPNSAGTPADTTLDVVNFDVTSDSTISVGAFTGVSTIDGTLTGSGDILFYLENAATGDAYDQYVSFTSVSGYTGALTVTENLGIEFGVSYTFANALTLQDSGSFLMVNSGQTLTFNPGDLVDAVNGAVGVGTYSGASLDALGASYVNNGGTIIVVPEPSAYALAGLGVGALAFLRRRRA